MLRKALGRRIRELRKLRDWSQEEFSDKAHIHRTFAGSVERGEKNISFHALVLISRCFGIPLSELFKGFESGDSPKPKRISPGTLDRDNLRSELAVLERTVNKLKDIAFREEDQNQPTQSIPKLDSGAQKGRGRKPGSKV